LAKLSELDYRPKPIEADFLGNASAYPVTGTHEGHEIRAEGLMRKDAEGKPYPTKLGVHGTHVAVDWEACIADGQCTDVCPVNVFGWFLRGDGEGGTGKDVKVANGSDKWNQYRTDKSDPIREADCIFCMACETTCPTLAIKITPK
jgi:NAD-dependent dihydropyrimidine dehydrogenase PreA subunit